MSRHAIELTVWLGELSDALRAAGFEVDDAGLDVSAVLDLARDAAHGVTRPAAPLTTFLVGYAAGRAGGSASDVRRASAVASELAVRAATVDREVSE